MLGITSSTGLDAAKRRAEGTLSPAQVERLDSLLTLVWESDEPSFDLLEPMELAVLAVLMQRAEIRLVSEREDGAPSYWPELSDVEVALSALNKEIDGLKADIRVVEVSGSLEEVTAVRVDLEALRVTTDLLRRVPA